MSLGSADGTENVTDGWHLWCSDTGSHYATRTDRQLTDEDLAAGLVMTIDADTPEELTRKLREQDDLLRDRGRGCADGPARAAHPH